MTVTIRRTGNIQLDFDKIARAAAALIPGLVMKRVAQGRDINDRPFAPYASSYRDALVAGGESTDVDLRLTGGMLNSLKLRETRHVGDTIVLIFAPDAGTSPSVSLADGRAKRTGQRGPAHNVVGHWLHHGTALMPARPWLGLSPTDLDALRRALANVKVLKA